MCGRYTVFTEQEIIEMREILNEINKNFAGQAVNMKTGEIFPTNFALIIISEGGVMAARPMFWGFPKWKGSGVIINARAETAADKPMFRSSLAARRCIVPSTGFYEWKHSGDKKQKDKYLINLPDTPMLYMAGIYNYYHESDGQQLPRFVILTTAANNSIAPLHDRMPVILSSAEKKDWLSGADMDALSRTGPDLVLKAG